MLAFNKTFNDRAAPVKGSGKVCSFYKKIYILIKPRKQASIWLSLSWWLHKPQNITAHYIYSRVNMYNQFQLRMFKFVFVLQVIVGPLAVVSCDILCLLFVQKNKNSELLLLINLASQKGKRIAWICDYMKIRWDLEWKQSICLKVHKY